MLLYFPNYSDKKINIKLPKIICFCKNTAVLISRIKIISNNISQIYSSILQISWSKKNGLLDNGHKFVEGGVYSMTNISEHQSGVYICQASNGVGYPVVQHINLTVLCKLSSFYLYLRYICLTFLGVFFVSLFRVCIQLWIVGAELFTLVLNMMYLHFRGNTVRICLNK